MEQGKIAILGGGNLGSSIVKGLLKSNFPGEKIIVTRRRTHLLENFKKEKVIITEDNCYAVKQANMVIIAVKPHQIFSLLSEIKDQIKPEQHILISTVTGVSIKEMGDVTGNIPLYRVMPNTAIALCESMTCIASMDTNQERKGKIIGLFDKLGKTVIINEELMGAATVLGACGIAFALRFMRAVSQGGIEIGFGAELSQQITAQTIKGASSLILESDNHPEQEIDKVTTPMGITISGLNEMEHQGFSSALIKGLITSYNKLGMLSKK
ncbi:MAG: pyrroline-5-carboxylate reductase [Bacteroidales bacterium]|nr:pyrroline-5-carboxylate reductase [Bacteroidales bacterium]